MSAAVQQYTISQGATLSSQLTIQVPGLPLNLSGITTLGSNAISGITTAGITIGMSITGFGIQPNTIVTTIVDSTDITISNPATASSVGAISLVVGTFGAINLTGVQFLFSAKFGATLAIAALLPDGNNPAGGVVEFNWTEVTTPLLGQTFLTIADTVTPLMAAGSWQYLLRAIGAPTLPASSDILGGILNVTTAVSPRIV